MRQYIKNILLGCVVVLLAGCNDDTTPVLDTTKSPALAPLNQPALVLNEASVNFIAETFSWSKGKYGFAAAPIYVLQIDNDAQFPDPVILGEASKEYLSVTVGKLNTAATILGAKPDVPKTLYLRLQANLTPDVVDYSQPLDISVTVFPQVIDYPKLYVPGSYQDWQITTAPSLLSSRMNNKYEGFLDMNTPSNPTSAIVFKLATAPSWSLGVQYGSGGAPGTLKSGGGDLSISPQAYYLFNVNLNTLSYTATPVTRFTATGSAVTAPSGEAELLYNSMARRWEGDHNLVSGTIQLSVNGNNSLIYGDGDHNNILDRFSDGEIEIPASGHYQITLTFTPVGVSIGISPLGVD